MSRIHTALRNLEKGFLNTGESATALPPKTAEVPRGDAREQKEKQEHPLKKIGGEIKAYLAESNGISADEISCDFLNTNDGPRILLHWSARALNVKPGNLIPQIQNRFPNITARPDAAHAQESYAIRIKLVK